MADPFVTEPKILFTGKVGSTQVKAGQAVYFDGTDWELADADDNTKYAEGIAVNTYESGAAGVFARGGIIVDTDAPYTLGDQHYLSTTAGAITATRPTGAVNLCQVIGEAFTTSEIYFDIPPVRELVVDIQYPYTGGSAPGDADNDFYGIGFDALAAIAAGGFMVPQNVVGIKAAYTWWCGTGVVLNDDDTFNFDVSGGSDDDTTSAYTDIEALVDLTVAANDLARADVTAGFSTTGIIEAGNYVGIKLQKAAEGSGGDDPIMLGTHVVLLAV